MLLSDKADVPFDELLTDSTYVAVVNIKDFLASTSDQDRAALFFLSALSNHGSISAASAGIATPIRVQQLVKALEVGLDGKSDVLLDVMNKGGSKLTLGLLDAAVKALDKTAGREDLEALTTIFSTSTASVIADAATDSQAKGGGRGVRATTERECQ